MLSVANVREKMGWLRIGIHAPLLWVTIEKVLKRVPKNRV
jgi:hypothetical protein